MPPCLFCLHLWDQKQQLVIRAKIPDFWRIRFSLLTLALTSWCKQLQECVHGCLTWELQCFRRLQSFKIVISSRSANSIFAWVKRQIPSASYSTIFPYISFTFTLLLPLLLLLYFYFYSWETKNCTYWLCSVDEFGHMQTPVIPSL